MKVKLYCTCGASATGTISPDAKAQAFIDKIWKQTHRGEGHKPCDAKTAAIRLSAPSAACWAWTLKR